MSNGIMEKNLPVAESLGSGDKVRIVTSAGNSKQIDAGSIGGALKVTATLEYDGDTVTGGSLDKTYREIENAQALMFVEIDSRGFTRNFEGFAFTYNNEYGAFVELMMRDGGGSLLHDFEFTAQTKDDTLVMAAD